MDLVLNIIFLQGPAFAVRNSTRYSLQPFVLCCCWQFETTQVTKAESWQEFQLAGASWAAQGKHRGVKASFPLRDNV